MSRQYIWVYSIPDITEAQWDRYFADCEQLTPFSHSWCQGGSGSPEGFDIWVYANKAKAHHRIKPVLDAYFGVVGTMEPSTW